MDFWKYNIGDEITTTTSTYRIIDRYVWLNYDEEVISAHERNHVKYLLWDRKGEDVAEMSECDIDWFFEHSGSTIKKNIADTVNVTTKKDSDTMTKQTNGGTVNHPSFYQGKIEVIDFIEDKKLGFNLGNCVKYISRAGKKNPEKLLEDLKKARWYLDREIANMEKKDSESQKGE